MFVAKVTFPTHPPHHPLRGSFPSRGSLDLCKHGMPYDGICKPPSEREGDRFSGGGSLRHFKIFALHHAARLLIRVLPLLRVLPHPTVSGAPSRREPWMSANKARGMMAYRYPVGTDVPGGPPVWRFGFSFRPRSQTAFSPFDPRFARISADAQDDADEKARGRKPQRDLRRDFIDPFVAYAPRFCSYTFAKLRLTCLQVFSAMTR